MSQNERLTLAERKRLDDLLEYRQREDEARRRATELARRERTIKSLMLFGWGFLAIIIALLAAAAGHLAGLWRIRGF